VHYYAAFRECPRQFFYKHVLGLKTAEKRAPLVKGKALHALQEHFLKGRDDVALKAALLAYFEENLGAFFDETEAQEALEGVWRAFVTWREVLGAKDLAELTSRAGKAHTEIELAAELAPGVIVTGRMDRLYEFCDTLDLDLIDTKTSSSTGSQKICENAFLADQLPVYAWLVEKTYGCAPRVFVDAVAFRKGPADVGRSEPMIFDSDTMEDARLSVLGTALDIQDRLTGTDWFAAPREAVRLAWPRHTQKCSLWGCPYSEICHTTPHRGDPLVGMAWATDAELAELAQGGEVED